MAAEPAELRAQRDGPLPFDENAGRTEEGPQAARRDPQLMNVLGIVATPGTGIVREERLDLLPESDAEGRTRGRARVDHRRSLRCRDVERAMELRPQHLLLDGTAPAHVSDEALEILLVAVHELDLDLTEPTNDALPLEHRHAVVDDLGATRPNRLPPRPQPRDRDELAPVQMRGKKLDQLGGRNRRLSGQLELEPRLTRAEA